MSDSYKLYNIVEVKLDNIADKLLLSNGHKDHNVLSDVHVMIEKIFIRSAMKISNNNISQAAKLLGINRNTLSKKLKDLQESS